MKRKRGNKKNNAKKFTAAAQNEYQTGLDDFENAEIESKMTVESPQGSTNMNDRQTGLHKLLLNERTGQNEVNSLHNRPIKSSKITTNSLRSLGSSILKLIGEKEPILPQKDLRYNEEELNSALVVIKKIMKMNAAGPFNIPVNPTELGIPDYFNVIDKPMDFGTICENLEKGHKYMNSEDVFKDVQLIWDNCTKYNKKGNFILELMKRVKTNFKRLWVAAGLYFEQPQSINGSTHLSPRKETNIMHTEPVQEHRESPVTDKPSQLQPPVQAGLNRLESHRLPSLFDQPQQSPQVETPDSSGMQKKKRGPTLCHKLWNTKGRIYIATNELGHPIGPDAPKLINFLGTIARDGQLAPLTFVNWKAMPEANKEKMWHQVEMKFEIDPQSKSWVMRSLAKKWSDWKSRLKADHYYPHSTNEERLADRDERVQPDQWSILISYWNLDEVEKRSAINKANRAQQKFNHTTGSKSFARLREEEKAKRPDGKEPSQAELFIMTRTRKDGQPLNKESSAVISKLREHTTQQNSKVPEDEVLCQALGKESICLGGPKPSRLDALKMVSSAKNDVNEMKEKMVSMEKTCAQMAAQMSTMMSMMSSIISPQVPNSSDPPQPPPVRSSTSRPAPVVPSCQTRAMNRGKVQDASTNKDT